MKISALTSTQVWAASSRSLTNIGSGALAVSDSVNQSLAAATNIDLRTSAGIVGQATAGVRSGAGATGIVQVVLTDNVIAYPVATAPAGALTFAVGSTINTNAVGLRIQNGDGAVAATFAVAQFLWTI